MSSSTRVHTPARAVATKPSICRKTCPQTPVITRAFRAWTFLVMKGSPVRVRASASPLGRGGMAGGPVSDFVLVPQPFIIILPFAMLGMPLAISTSQIPPCMTAC